tara:strand:+ start:77 stop:502 length:426 start_codon:yes stop_codon:yes gene_type:complete
MRKIYLIEDINHLKYIGNTKITLNKRLSKHKSDKKRGFFVSSSLLDLNDCEISLIEECEDDKKREREQYWINNTDCVNLPRGNPVSQSTQKQIRDKYNKSAKGKETNKLYNKKSKDYRKSWGGDERYQNNLLKISLDVFQD